jgi:hypothetical protein
MEGDNEWQEVKSDSGKPYYYNTQTKAVSWTKPKSKPKVLGSFLHPLHFTFL